MKQAGFEAKLRDGVDSVGLDFDFSEAPPPTPEEIAAMQQQQGQQGGGQVQTSFDSLVPTPDLLMKLTPGASGHLPESIRGVEGTGIPPLSSIGDSQVRQTAGRSPERIKRVDGAPGMASRRGDKRDDRSVEEIAADEKIKESERRAGGRGQR